MSLVNMVNLDEEFRDEQLSKCKVYVSKRYMVYTFFITLNAFINIGFNRLIRHIPLDCWLPLHIGLEVKSQQEVLLGECVWVECVWVQQEGL